MSTQLQIQEFLSQGLSPVQVASALGISESYISQLMGQEDFAAQVAEKRQAVAKEGIEFDKKIERTEQLYLERIEQKAPMANLQQSLQAFKVLNQARKRRDGAIIPQQNSAGVVVNITLPTAVIPQYVTNSKAEIVEVEGKTMVAATPKKLDELVQQKTGQLPTPSKAEQAAELLDNLQVRPVRRLTKSVPTDQLADLL